jgi:hypothetical protein
MTPEDKQGALTQALNIEEDCTCSAKQYWNDGTALSRANDRVSTWSALLACKAKSSLCERLWIDECLRYQSS